MLNQKIMVMVEAAMFSVLVSIIWIAALALLSTIFIIDLITKAINAIVTLVSKIRKQK